MGICSYKNEKEKLSHRILLQKVMQNAEEGAIISIVDDSEYEEGKSNNGGCYSFSIKYIKRGNRWEAHYFSSADFPYCSRCGSFVSDNHYCGKHSLYRDFDILPFIQNLWFKEGVSIEVCV